MKNAQFLTLMLLALLISTSSFSKESNFKLCIKGENRAAELGEDEEEFDSQNQRIQEQILKLRDGLLET